MKDKAQTITFGIVLVFLFGYFMQAFNMPNVLTVVAGAVLCLVMLIQQKKFRVDAGICLLTLTLVSYYVIVNGVKGLFFPILYISLVVYVLASYSVHMIEKEKALKLLLFAFVAGYAIHGVLNAYMYYAGYVIPGTRQWQDFWTRAIVPGTQHTAYFLPVLAMFLPAVVYFKKRKWLNAVIIIATAFFGYTSLATKSRMAVVIFALAFCAQALIFIISEREFVKKIVSNKKFWFLCAVMLVVVAIGVYAVKDSAVVVAFIENMGKGGGILNNVRFEAQRMALEQLFDYPMGGRLMDLGRTYCHNTWLDMANAGGIIPFFAFTAYTLYTVYGVVCLLLKKSVSAEWKIVLTGLYVVFFLFLSVEPALDASVHLVTPWIFVNGLIHGIISQK